MELEDVKVGMFVKDKFGNEYVITAFDKPDYRPVKLKCTKFKRDCFVEGVTVFTDVDDEWWIVNDEVDYKEFDNYDIDISLKSINQMS